MGPPIRVAPAATGRAGSRPRRRRELRLGEQLHIEHADPDRHRLGERAARREHPGRSAGWCLRRGRGRGLGDERRRPRRSCGSTRTVTPSLHAFTFLPARPQPPVRAPSGSPIREEDNVSRIDPKTNKVTATIHIREQPSGVAVSPGAVWIASTGGPSVTRIDPATNRVVATIRVGPNRECCAERMGLTASGDAVWVANNAGRRIVRIDPRTNKVVDSIRLGHFMPCGFLAADRSAVWSAGAVCTGAVARIDPRSKRVTAKLAEPHAVGLALAFGSLWVAVFESGDVDRIDPRTGQVAARLHVGGWPVRLGVGFGSVWVNDDKGRVLQDSAAGLTAPRWAQGSPWNRSDLRAIPEEKNDGRWFDRATSCNSREPPRKEPASCAASFFSSRLRSSLCSRLRLQPTPCDLWA